MIWRHAGGTHRPDDEQKTEWATQIMRSGESWLTELFHRPVRDLLSLREHPWRPGVTIRRIPPIPPSTPLPAGPPARPGGARVQRRSEARGDQERASASPQEASKPPLARRRMLSWSSNARLPNALGGARLCPRRATACSSSPRSVERDQGEHLGLSCGVDIAQLNHMEWEKISPRWLRKRSGAQAPLRRAAAERELLFRALGRDARSREVDELSASCTMFALREGAVASTSPAPDDRRRARRADRHCFPYTARTGRTTPLERLQSAGHRTRGAARAHSTPPAPSRRRPYPPSNLPADFWRRVGASPNLEGPRG